MPHHSSRVQSASTRRWKITFVAVGFIVSLTVGCSFSPRGRNTDGVRAYQLGKYNQAIERFQTALAQDPNNANAFYNLAATYYSMGKQTGDKALMSQAEDLYHQCLDLNPDHIACYRGLASLLVETDRQESAFTLMRRWAQRSYHSAEPRIELARLHEDFGDRESAIQHLTDALNIDGRNARAWAALGHLREQRGEYAQALADYQRSYGLNQNQPGIGGRIAALQSSVVR